MNETDIRCHQCAATRQEYSNSPEPIPVVDTTGNSGAYRMTDGCCSMSRGFLQAAARDFYRWQELVIAAQEREDLRTGKSLSETMTPGWSQRRQVWRERGYGDQLYKMRC
jgi:hypothetical protein